MTTMTDVPPEYQRPSLFRDLLSVRIGTIALILGCLALGQAIRDETFSDDDDEEVVVDDGDWFVRSVGSDWAARQKRNRELIQTLNRGDKKEVISTLLGAADHVDRLSDHIEVLFYRTHQKRSDGITTRNETTPLVMIDGALDSWGEPAGGSKKRVNKVFAGDNWETRQEANKLALDALQVGTSKADALSQLGKPDFVDAITPDLEILSYRTHSVTTDGFTGRDETTSLIFNVGELIGKR